MWFRERAVSGLARHFVTGVCGEDTASKYLKEIGYKIWHKNVRVGRRHEIDLIALDPGDRVIVFVEVKTRSVFHPDFRPELCFTYKKRLKLQHAVRQWVGLHEYDGGYRMDLICIADNRLISHIKNLDWV